MLLYYFPLEIIKFTHYQTTNGFTFWCLIISKFYTLPIKYIIHEYILNNKFINEKYQKLKKIANPSPIWREKDIYTLSPRLTGAKDPLRHGSENADVQKCL